MQAQLNYEFIDKQLNSLRHSDSLPR